MAIAILGSLAAGCSAAGTSNGPAIGTAQPGAQRTLNDNRSLANGFGSPSAATGARPNGWVSPERKRRHKPTLFYWGNYDTNTITILSSSGKQKGQITSGLYNPERLFVDKKGDVFATNIGYNGSSKNSITGYKPGQTTPFITITNGVNRPTGLTVDGAGTVYCANVGNNTITVYPKGQTSPSLTIPYFAEYLAPDAQDNLYAAGTAVEFDHGHGPRPSGLSGGDRGRSLRQHHRALRRPDRILPGGHDHSVEGDSGNGGFSVRAFAQR
jgi:hypothetical protein